MKGTSVGWVSQLALSGIIKHFQELNSNYKGKKKYSGLKKIEKRPEPGNLYPNFYLKGWHITNL